MDALAEDFDGISPMQFGYNDPMSFNDPTGLFSFGPGPGTGVLSGGKSGSGGFLSGIGKNTVEFGAGFLTGVGNGAKGLYDFVTAAAWQTQTWKNTGMLLLGMSLGSDPYGDIRRMQFDRDYGTNTFGVTRAFQTSIANGGNTLIHGSAQQRGEIIGRLAFDIAGTKGIAAGGRMLIRGSSRLNTMTDFLSRIEVDNSVLNSTFPKLRLVKISEQAISKFIKKLRNGEDIVVNSVDEAREILRNMQDLRPHVDKFPANSGMLYKGSKFSTVWQQPRGTFRGDLLNVKDPSSNFVHKSGNLLHDLNPHYNILFHNEKKASIIIKN